MSICISIEPVHPTNGWEVVKHWYFCNPANVVKHWLLLTPASRSC
ncbi:hypothetical protein SLEP1_g6611 [Rubroshorea leprosula]|uniref:Uncharacterized protein n=1 Tax=Rubroshorea leprosula TaxID=152421 RepID=A0AAV5I1R6_9ROSI|nr:hypothetical protein SLEP1_g6611 [Rubroshorea leprosula]